nr:MerR family transcriptional regulator [Nocardioides thalensis]
MMRIGELSRRTGVSPELLRAWEQRYGLLQPTRSPGGFRLYSADDEARVRRTNAHLEDGLSAAEAARLAMAEASEEPVVPAGDGQQSVVAYLAVQLRDALDRYDAAGGHAALDRLFGTVSVEFALTEVLIPYLHELGERWASGEITVAQEHFAANLVRGRLLGLTRDWGSGGSSSALLACLPGENHDLGLILLGVLIARRGWRVTFLGANTPFDGLEASILDLRPSLVVLATIDAGLFHEHAASVSSLAAMSPLAVTAPVDDGVISATGARPLVHDIAAAASSLSSR